MANDTTVKKVTDVMVTRPWTHGYEVKALVFPDDTQSEAGKNGVDKITCSMEEADSGCSPWFAIWIEGRVRVKYNARHLAAVIHL